MNPWNQAAYQGAGKRRRYFEGWYFKLVDETESETWSIIPGIALGPAAGQGYSFVQAIEGRTARTWWYEYPLSAFEASSDRLDIRVGPSRFSSDGIELFLGEGEFEGRVGFGPFLAPPLRLLRPGVMGPYSFVPFMECRHGLVSLDHGLSGAISAEGRRIDLSGGRGYAEKDWGRSMPQSWIWSQSNNFPARGDSFMLSIARIPWLGSSFPGFLFAASLGGRLVLETTWTGARIEALEVGESRVGVAIRGRLGLVEVDVGRNRSGTLRAPVDGLLTRRISECVDAVADLRWRPARGPAFEGRAERAGLEVVGDLASLAAPRRRPRSPGAAG